jgi:hypothetical protein
MSLHPNHAWIKLDDAPVYVLTYPAYDEQDALAAARYAELHQQLYMKLAGWAAGRTRAFSFVVDLSEVRSTAMNRQRAIQFLERVRQRGNPHLVCRAFVTPNESVRGVMTAVFWQTPPDYPHRFFQSVADAKAWARAETLQADLVQRRSSQA